MAKIYQEKNVLEASRDRIRFIFDRFENVRVSFSGGKDSTVLLYLTMQVAEELGRKVEVFFLDQEAEYAATIDLVKIAMRHELAIPIWLQVPIYMTNATSGEEYFLYAWGEGQEWMRSKDDIAIHEWEGPSRFYEAFPWLEKRSENTAHLIGLRTDESITRYRAATKNPGYDGLYWSTTAQASGAHRFYPIYDWGIPDVWRFIYEYDLPYNKLYDLMLWDGYTIYSMRVSNLIHEKSYKCLVDLPRFEPDTFDALCKRVAGIDTAQRYAAEKMVFSNKALPKHYKNWKEYRDFLLQEHPVQEHKTIFMRRFENQPKNEKIYQAQVGQLLINDWENNKPIDKNAKAKADEIKKKWMEIL